MLWPSAWHNLLPVMTVNTSNWLTLMTWVVSHFVFTTVTQQTCFFCMYLTDEKVQYSLKGPPYSFALQHLSWYGICPRVTVSVSGMERMVLFEQMEALLTRYHGCEVGVNIEYVLGAASWKHTVEVELLQEHDFMPHFIFYSELWVSTLPIQWPLGRRTFSKSWLCSLYSESILNSFKASEKFQWSIEMTWSIPKSVTSNFTSIGLSIHHVVSWL